MSNICDINKIDAIGIDKENNSVVLAIFDHLNWEDEYDHLLLLQDKVNVYINCIESGGIYSSYLEAKNHNTFIIDIKFKYPITENCKKLIKHIQEVLSQIKELDLKINLKYEITEN